MSAVVTEIRSRRPDATTQQPVQREHVELRMGGMTCAHCPPAAIEKAAAAVPGVISASVNPSTKIARIDYDSARTKIADILQAIRSVCVSAWNKHPVIGVIGVQSGPPH